MLADRPYALITLLQSVLLLYLPLLGWVLPLWVAQRTTAPHWTVAAVFALNTITVMTCQVRVARSVTDLATAGRAVRRAGVLMLLACAAFALSAVTAAPWAAQVALLTGAALQVAAEMLQAAGTWQISFDLAPPERQGQYQGFFGSATALARIVGPVALTALLLGEGGRGWLVLGVGVAAAAAAMRPAVRWAERHRPGAGPRSAAAYARLGGERVDQSPQPFPYLVIGDCAVPQDKT